MKSDNLLKEKWDNLIILDGCRYDVFDNVNWLNGNLTKKWSTGGWTGEWIKNTFNKTKYMDIVYFSSNPYMTESGLNGLEMQGLEFDCLFDLVKYRSKPKEIINYILPLYSKFSNKKKIIHFMQPHVPFLGGELKGMGAINAIKEKLKNKNGYYDGDKLKEAYKINLKIALEVIGDKLLPILKGKTVLTSDHGNACGEDDHWLHVKKNPNKWYMREVPYFEYDPEIHIKKHLEELGYI